MAIRPVVDAVEREFGEALRVIRVNVQDPAGRELTREFGFEFTPTFILFDGEGQERWRSIYALDPVRLRELVPRD